VGALLSSQGGIGASEILLNEDPIANTGVGVDCTYTPTYSGLLITTETWVRNDATNIKTIDYTYTGDKVTTEVRKVFALDGTTIVAQLTWSYVYAGNIVTSATMVRNV
jgi:hypothetical protein